MLAGFVVVEQGSGVLQEREWGVQVGGAWILSPPKAGVSFHVYSRAGMASLQDVSMINIGPYLSV